MFSSIRCSYRRFTLNFMVMCFCTHTKGHGCVQCMLGRSSSGLQSSTANVYNTKQPCETVWTLLDVKLFWQKIDAPYTVCSPGVHLITMWNCRLDDATCWRTCRFTRRCPLAFPTVSQSGRAQQERPPVGAASGEAKKAKGPRRLEKTSCCKKMQKAFSRF